eukprot:3583755-Amphidinium_carterae.1
MAFFPLPCSLLCSKQWSSYRKFSFGDAIWSEPPISCAASRTESYAARSFDGPYFGSLSTA